MRVRTRRSLTDAGIDEAARLYADGLLLREVGARLGVSRDCVRLTLKRRGVTLRSGLGARSDAAVVFTGLSAPGVDTGQKTGRGDQESSDGISPPPVEDGVGGESNEDCD